MNELKLKFIYNGEKSFSNFLSYIKRDDEFEFDKNVWSGEVKIGGYVFIEKEKCFLSICFRVFFTLQEKKGVLVRMNLWSK